MDWTMMLTAVLTFVGGGGLGAVLMFPQKRKSAELENETKASEQWKELYIKSQEEKKGLSNLIDKLYDDQGHFRDENNRLTTQIAVYKVLKCRDLKCTNRNPPIDNNINSEDKEDKDCDKEGSPDPKG